MWRILIRSAPVVGSIFGHSWKIGRCRFTEVLILLLNIYNGAYSDKTPLCVHSYKSTLFLSHLIIGIGLPLAPRLQWMSEALYFCCLLIHSFHHCHMVSFEPVEQPIKAKQTKQKYQKLHYFRERNVWGKLFTDFQFCPISIMLDIFMSRRTPLPNFFIFTTQEQNRNKKEGKWKKSLTLMLTSPTENHFFAPSNRKSYLSASKSTWLL